MKCQQNLPKQIEKKNPNMPAKAINKLDNHYTLMSCFSFDD